MSMSCHLNIEIPKKPANKTASEHRRATKPIMEKRRRARINHSLNELKSLLLDALNKDPSRNSKLEKADILEMAVKHLQNLQRQQMALEVARDPSVLSKYKAGFTECASEVTRYVQKIDGVDPPVKQRLIGHLNHCVQSLPPSPPASGVFNGQTIAFPGMSFPSSGSAPLQVHIPVNMGHHMFSSSSGASTPSSAVNLTTTSSDINNNNRRSESSSEASKLTPPASASSAFSFSFPSAVASSHPSSLSPVTPTTPSTPGFTSVSDYRYAPYHKYSVHPWSGGHQHRRDVLRSVSPGSSSMGSLSPVGSDSVDCESIASSSDKNCNNGDVWRPW